MVRLRYQFGCATLLQYCYARCEKYCYSKCELDFNEADNSYQYRIMPVAILKPFQSGLFERTLIFNNIG